MDPLNELIDGAQKRWPPNRVAIALGVVLTPLVAAGAAAGLAWLARHFPGLPPVTAAQVTVIFVAGFVPVAAGVVALFYKWVDGHQKREAARHNLLTAAIASGHPTSAITELENAVFSPVTDPSQGASQ